MEIIFKLFITSGPLRLCGSGGAAAVGKGIAVTTVINLPASGGRREFVYQINPPPLISDTLVTGLGEAAAADCPAMSFVFVW